MERSPKAKPSAMERAHIAEKVTMAVLTVSLTFK